MTMFFLLCEHVCAYVHVYLLCQFHSRIVYSARVEVKTVFNEYMRCTAVPAAAYRVTTRRHCVKMRAVAAAEVAATK